MVDGLVKERDRKDYWTGGQAGDGLTNGTGLETVILAVAKTNSALHEPNYLQWF